MVCRFEVVIFRMRGTLSVCNGPPGNSIAFLSIHVSSVKDEQIGLQPKSIPGTFRIFQKRHCLGQTFHKRKVLTQSASRIFFGWKPLSLWEVRRFR